MPPPSKKLRGGPSLAGSVHVRAKSYRQMAEESWTTPVSDSEVTPDIKAEYDEIKASILSIPWASGIVAIKRYFQELVSCIKIKAAVHPTLARVVAQDMHHSSMLTMLCDKAHTPLAHSTIKFLIERNPSALLWKRDNWQKMGIAYSMPIYTIANHHAHHVLLPWIAEHYPWVLEHPMCQAHPPTFDFIDQCINGIALNSAVIRQYFTKYPQALRHTNASEKSTPLHHFLAGFTECRLELFQWLVNKCPSTLLQPNAAGWTPLHSACSALVENPSNNMKEICKFIIRLAPQTVYMKAKGGELPIHILKDRHNKPNIQEIIMQLLRAYPESHRMFTSNPSSYPMPNRHPFVKKVLPLILEEKELQATASQLQRMPVNLAMAFSQQAATIDPLFSSAAKVFTTWSKTKRTAMEHQRKDILRQIEVVGEQAQHQRDTGIQAFLSTPGATETEHEETTDEGSDFDDC